MGEEGQKEKSAKKTHQKRQESEEVWDRERERENESWQRRQ